MNDYLILAAFFFGNASGILIAMIVGVAYLSTKLKRG